MNREERLAYARGYNSGVKRRWPDHKPPLPPDELCRELVKALVACRDALDSLLSTFDESDGTERQYGPAIDTADDVLEKVTQWLKEPIAP